MYIASFFDSFLVFLTGAGSGSDTASTTELAREFIVLGGAAEFAEGLVRRGDAALRCARFRSLALIGPIELGVSITGTGSGTMGISSTSAVVPSVVVVAVPGMGESGRISTNGNGVKGRSERDSG